MAETINCSPRELIAATPCAGCLSESQLQALILFLISLGSDYELPGDMAELLEDSACFSCMSNKQMLQAIAQVLATVNFESGDGTALQETAGCLLCANPKQILGAITFLLCETNFMVSRILDSGIVQLSAGGVSVLTDKIASTTPVLLSYLYVSGTKGTVSYSSIIDGIAFNIESTNPADTNYVSWAVLKP